MALALRLEDPFAAGGEATPELRLDRRGAIIGRSPTIDWVLPDPESIVSSNHCRIAYQDGDYLLVDTSTNGTAVNGRPLTGSHRLADGDLLVIGRYRVRVALDAPAAATAPSAAVEAGRWGGWDEHLSPEPVGVDPRDWGRPRPTAELNGGGALSRQWAPPPLAAPEPAPTPSRQRVDWDSLSEPAPPAQPPSGWSSAGAATPAAGDIWGRLAESNVVDWARGGFGADPLPPAEERLALNPPLDPQALGPNPARHTPAPAPAPPSPPEGAATIEALVAAAGLRRADLPGDGALAEAGGRLLRRLVAGLVVMLEARARAKAQMGAAGTSLEYDGNNPLKFARTPEGALTQLLRPPERGFMPAERAVEDAFLDLQAHQVATLKAMQGALTATLARFSPDAIRKRATTKGLLARILSGSRDAALWQAYEREFSGVARGSDEAFMDVFAKEFRRAYEQAATTRR